RNDDFLHRPAQMLLGIAGIGESSRGLDYHLRAHRLPGQRSRVFLLKNLDGFLVDRDAVGSRADVVWKVAEDRIVLQQMRQGFGIREVVNRYELEIRVIQ